MVRNEFAKLDCYYLKKLMQNIMGLFHLHYFLHKQKMDLGHKKVNKAVKFINIFLTLGYFAVNKLEL